MNPNDLIEGVKRLSSQLDSSGIPHAFGGAIAYGFYGNPRVTNDYDINIVLPESSAPDVFKCLSPLGVQATAESVADVERKGQVRLPWQAVMVDLFFAYAPFHAAAAERVEQVAFAGRALRVLSAEDLIVFKVLFNRPYDWEDIERIIEERLARLDVGYVARWLAEILGPDDGRIERWREAVTRDHPPTSDQPG